MLCALRLGIPLAKATDMKSQVNGLLHVVRGLIKDVLAAYPALRGLELDYKSLTLSCQTRGLSFLTLDLPNLDSLLIKGLDNGRLELSGPVSRQVSKSVKVPRLFSGLWLRVFDKDACLKPDADVNSIFFLRSLCAIGKKLEVDCSPERIQTAMENYHDIERRLRSPSNSWDSDSLDLGSDRGRHHLGDCLDSVNCGPLFSSQGETQEEEVGRNEDRGLLEKIQQTADLLLSSFDDLCPVGLSGLRDMDSQGIGFRHGRGAVAERKKNWDKSRFDFWPSKLEGVFPFRKCGTTAGSDLETPRNHESPSRLHCVPKTAKSPRLIAAEPVAHQWCQQAVLSWFDSQFREKLDGHFIDLHDQGKSGAMVLQASLTQKLATVDLSDASDRVSCWTVERIFRTKPDILYALHAARTRYVRDEVSRHMGFFKTKKFASQGTATTFPVMSFTMLCVALGSCIRGDVTWSKIHRLRHHVRVYGDDIILPTHGYARLSRAMVLLQLKVNEAKSYVNGHFRESCGIDGYMGYDVTPVKPKTIVADTPASCKAVLDYRDRKSVV